MIDSRELLEAIERALREADFNAWREACAAIEHAMES